MPDMWVRVPFIALSNSELANYYDLTDKECAYIEVFDSHGRYKLQEKLEEAYNKMPAERTRFDKDFSRKRTIRITNGMRRAMICRRFPEKTPCSLPTLWAGIYRRYKKD